MGIITLKNITKKYNNKIALNNINLCLEENGIIGLVGPNGAGKTTLFRIIMNLIKPTSGEVKLWNNDINIYNVGNKISYCSDGDNLYQDLTVKENLEFIVRAYNIKDGEGKIEELCSLFKMDKELDNEAKNLSKGMKKKVALIRTLLNSTPILIMDEPMSWLDLENQRLLNKILKSLSSTSLIIISSHNMSHIESLCDKVIILNQDIRFFGEIKNIKSNNIDKSLEDIYFEKVRDEE